MTDLQNLVISRFVEAGLDPAFGCAIIEHESNWNPKARSPVTASDEKYGGAWGLCQLTLVTAKGLGYSGDGPGLWDPHVNCQYFIKLTQRNISQLHTVSIEDLISAHNSGKLYLHAPFTTRTQYVPIVKALYDKWAKLIGTGHETIEV